MNVVVNHDVLGMTRLSSGMQRYETNTMQYTESQERISESLSHGTSSKAIKRFGEV